MLALEPGKKINTFVTDYVVYDLETTGISTRNDEIVEISAVKVEGGQVTDEFSTLVNPGRSIPFAASQVNGITDDMVKDSPGFAEVFGNFIEFVGNLPLVGHNIGNFDMKFLYRDARKFWNKTIGNDYIDTLPLAKQILPQLSHHRLVDLAEFYNISSAGAHRALNDCRMNQKVFECLRQELKNPESDRFKLCPQCGQIMKRRNGRYGEFWGCGGYPACKHTENISWKN